MHIGQKVRYIGNDISSGFYTRNQRTYTIKNIIQSDCCGDMLLEFSEYGTGYTCCSKHRTDLAGAYWLASLFSPIITGINKQIKVL